MFRVKICGITNVVDALAVADAGADAIGLNCYAGSPRFCPIDEACAIARAVPRSMVKVGVFVNASADEIHAVAETIGLDLVQLHGDEPPELLRDVRPLAVMKAFRVAKDFSQVEEFLQQCHHLLCVPRMLLVDALRGDQYGGTGTTLDWQALHAARHSFAGVPLVLAGGLNPSNVGEAITTVHPWAVDVASGVEQSAGKKSAQRVRAFVQSAKEAFSPAR